MNHDSQWAKLLPKDAYGKPSVIQKAPPNTIKGRPYQARLPYYFSSRYVTINSVYRGPAPKIRWAVIKPERVTAGSISSDTIITIVIGVFGISWQDIRSQRRDRKVMRPRQAAYALLKQFTWLSFPEIGARLGGRDHTTILHGVRQATLLYANDPTFAAKMDECRKQLLEEMACSRCA